MKDRNKVSDHFPERGQRSKAEGDKIIIKPGDKIQLQIKPTGSGEERVSNLDVYGDGAAAGGGEWQLLIAGEQTKRSGESSKNEMVKVELEGDRTDDEAGRKPWTLISRSQSGQDLTGESYEDMNVSTWSGETIHEETAEDRVSGSDPVNRSFKELQRDAYEDSSSYNHVTYCIENVMDELQDSSMRFQRLLQQAREESRD